MNSLRDLPVELPPACPSPGRSGFHPSDTYADEGARVLIQRAMAARSQEAEGVESYEGVLRERAYLGFAGLTFRRERSLFQSGRVAWVRWRRDEGRTIEWIGSRDELPILGGRGWVQWRKPNADTEGSISIGLGPGGESLSDETKEKLQETMLSNLNPKYTNS